MVTGTPNFPDGVVHEDHSARRYARRVHGGLPVLHTPLYPSHDASAARRIINYLSWAIAASVAVPVWTRSRRADVALVYSSPATAALPAMVLKVLRRTPYVLLVEDLWPDSVTATGFMRSRIARRLIIPALDAFVRLTYRMAAHVAVTSSGMGRALVDRGVPADRVSLVYNWLREEESLGSMQQSDGHLHLVYGGNLGRAQGLETVVHAIAEVGDPTVRVSFVGDGVCRDELEMLAEELIPGQADFRPRVPLREFQEIARSASALVVSLAADPLFDMTLPGKVQSSLAMGVPVIVSAGRDARELVDGAVAGWTAEAGDVSGLAAAIVRAREAGPAERAERGRLGRELFDSELSEDVNAVRLADLLKSAATGRRGLSHGGKS